MKMMPRGLFAQLMLLVTLIIAAAFTSFGFITGARQAGLLEGTIRNESLAITRNMAYSCARFLVVSDYAGLEDLLVRSAELSGIEQIQACERDGTVVADVVAPRGAAPRVRNDPRRMAVPGAEEPRLEPADGRLVVWHPVRAGGVLGWVRATYGLGKLAEIKAAVWTGSAVLAAVWITVSFGLVLLVLRPRIRAIQRLTRFARDLNAQKGAQIPVPSSSAEIGELAASLNRASRDLLTSERRLVAESERFEVTLESIGEGVIAADTGGQIVLFNRAAAELTGWAPEEARGRPLTEVLALIHEETKEPLEMALAPAKHGPVPMPEHAAILTRDGLLRSLAVTMAPIVDRDGGVIGVVLSFRDMTEKKKAERFLKGVFDSMGEGLIVVDREFRIISANRNYAENAGLSVEQVIGRRCHEVSHGSAVPCRGDTVCPVAETFRTGEQSMSVHHHASGTESISAEVRSFPVRDEGGRVVSAIETMTDVTQQRMLEEQLRQAQKMEAVGQLAGGVAHDFNNILTAILGYGQLITMMPGVQGRLKTYLEHILSSAERAAGLTSSLLAFSRKQVMEMKAVDLNELVRGMDKFLRRLISEDVELRTVLREGELTAMADSGQVQQVIMNLVTNARDAMSGGGVLTIGTGTAEIDESYLRDHLFEKTGRFAVVSVTDTGTGMDAETRARIFEPFFTTKETGRGTGLGLSIVYGIVKQHGGAINVYSEPGRGTTFKVYLPLAETGAGGGQVRALEPPRGGSETVLLAEDDEGVRNLLRLVLTGAGYGVVEAADGDEAVAMFLKHQDRIGMVLTDVIMPRKNGREVCDALRAVRPEVKVLFMSGYPADFIRREGITDEVEHYLSKPVSPDALLRTVRDILDGASASGSRGVPVSKA